MSETTQQIIVQTLREKVLSGALAPGQRLVEAHLADQLGVSRTPLRYALSVLSGEGLLERSAGRGFAVRRFSVTDILNAIDVRGVLEGLAARSVAERGVAQSLSAALQECLLEGDEIFSKGRMTEGDDVRYAALNGRFHALIVEGAANAALGAALHLNDKIPFVAAVTVVFDETAKERQFAMLTYAHRQHHAIVSALTCGEGARAEALMREHTNISKESLNLFPDKLSLIVGAA
jgi:GntR family transcriptional regulator of vanillate catabolism